MLVPAKPNPLPALALAALPPATVAGFAVAFLSFVGGCAAVWRMGDAAGPYSLLMLGAGLAVTLVLSALLSLDLAGRRTPLVMLVGLATLPWFLGIAGTEDAMSKVLAALPDVANGDALTVLVAGTGEAMVTRLLGAWTSAALLVSVALGLVPLSRRALSPGEVSYRLLAAALVLVLGGTALLVALEAHHLFELLTTLATQAPEARSALIASGTVKLASLQGLHSAALGVLCVLALALVGRHFFPRPRPLAQWAESLVLAALAASVLVLDARPLQLAAQGAQEAGLSQTLLPMLMARNEPLDAALGTVPPLRLPAP